MMKKIIFLFFVILTMLFWACENVIDVDLPEYTPKLVIDGFFSTETSWQIRVSNSTGILDINSPESIENAVVKIVSDEEEIQLLKVSGLSGVYGRPGKYPQPGKYYTLYVSAAGYADVSSINSIPAAAQIISVDTTHYIEDYGHGWRETNIELTLVIKDDPARDNYYHLSLYDRQSYMGEDYYNRMWFSSDNPGIISENEGDGDGFSFSGNSAVFNDYLFSGEEYKIKLKEIYDYGVSNLVVVLTAISKDFFLFEKSAARSSDDAGVIFSEPEAQYTNIENGLGIFAGFNRTYFEVK